MYQIVFYEDDRGFSDIKEYIKNLDKNNSKDGRIKTKKIAAYFDYLEEYGQKGKEPFVKKVTDELWELRPLRDRFMYAFIKDNKIIVLSQFMKTTQETPKREIEKAKRRLNLYKERGDYYD